MTRVLLSLVRWYRRRLSPHIPPTCRFTPTCSAFAAEALERHGWARGGGMAIRRVLKCHPFHPGGKDFVE